MCDERQITTARRRPTLEVEEGASKFESQPCKKRGRPVQGDGVKVISLSMEKSLLKREDDFVKRKGMSRAALIA